MKTGAEESAYRVFSNDRFVIAFSAPSRPCATPGPHDWLAFMFDGAELHGAFIDFSGGFSRNARIDR
jgi:hypothetical protein